MISLLLIGFGLVMLGTHFFSVWAGFLGKNIRDMYEEIGDGLVFRAAPILSLAGVLLIVAYRMWR